MNCKFCGSTENLRLLRDGTYACPNCAFNSALCIACNRIFLKKDCVHISYIIGYACKNCYETEFITCSVCHKPTKKIDFLSEYNCCKTCFEVIYTNCKECNKIVKFSNSLRIYNAITGRYCGSVCLDCYEKYTHCQQCGIVLLQHRYEICNYCADRIVKNDYLKYYLYKPNKFTFHRKNGELDSLYMGIELELEFMNAVERFYALKEIEKLRKLQENTFYCKKDGSLVFGIEIVTHPMTLNFHRNMFNWNEILNIVKSRDYQIRNSCGLHIHVNRNYFRTIEQIKLGIFVYTYYKELSRIGGRKLNRFCKLHPTKKSLKSMHLPYDRYEIVNFINSKTIEFRFPKATIDFSELMARIELIHAICMYCKETGIGIIAKGGWNKFVEFVQNKENYKYLKNIIKPKRRRKCA